VEPDERDYDRDSRDRGHAGDDGCQPSQTGCRRRVPAVRAKPV
jgi:hypothetical protein